MAGANQGQGSAAVGGTHVCVCVCICVKEGDGGLEGTCVVCTSLRVLNVEWVDKWCTLVGAFQPDA